MTYSRNIATGLDHIILKEYISYVLLNKNSKVILQNQSIKNFKHRYIIGIIENDQKPSENQFN